MTTAEFIYTRLLKPRPLRWLANSLIKSILPTICKVEGACIHLNPDDPVVSGALTLGVYEKEEIAFFVESLQPGSTLVDIGANVGLYTALGMKQLGPTGKVVSIEPDTESIHYLQQTIQANSRANQTPPVSLYSVALADTCGTATLHKNPENKGDNRLYADPLCTDTLTVHTRTLDSLLEAAGIDSVQFIKIDVQGAEAKVIAGARKTLANTSECIIMTEFWPYGLSKCDSDPNEYLNMLSALDFRLFLLTGGTLQPIENQQELISQCTGRIYRNLVAIKRAPAGNGRPDYAADSP